MLPPVEIAQVQTQRTLRRQTMEPCDPVSLERAVRQLLADKVSGSLAGTWLLAAELQRLGAYDLLCGWTGREPGRVEPRLALQAVYEAALCVSGVRSGRSLTQKGLELACGLPFVASDQAMHELFAAQPVARTRDLQVALGRLRRTFGHFAGQLLAIDPHHMRSYTQRQTSRCRHKAGEAAVKIVKVFFCLDAQTRQPLAFTLASASRSVSQAIPDLLDMAQEILEPAGPRTAPSGAPASARPLVLADKEHLTREICQHVCERAAFDLVCPMKAAPALRQREAAIPPQAFTPRSAGLAMARLPFEFGRAAVCGPLHQIVERFGEVPADYRYKSFLTTSQEDPVALLCQDFPQRWHIEEFFNAEQAMGWNRAGTLNLQVRYAQLTLALVAQGAVHQLRERLGEPFQQWDARHLATDLFQGLDGDIRVANKDTILVTYYNAPNAERLRAHYEHFPQKLHSEGIAPEVPWLYNFKLDFRFR